MPRKLCAVIGTSVLALMIGIYAAPAQADSIRNQQWYLTNLKASEAQSITKGAGVTVAVIDSGTEPHPDLRQNLLPGRDFLPGVSAGGNGRQDSVGHGTGIAALIAGAGTSPNNGIIGIAPAAKILPIKIVDEDTATIGGPSQQAGEAITWAEVHGAKVINMSTSLNPSFSLQNAVKSALDSGVVIVAAAGNVGQGDIGTIYPAALDGVLTVGASGRDGKYNSLSTKSSKVDICAPGVDIYTASLANKYAKTSGTSASTAIVSGAAALVRAKFPQMSGKEVVHRLTATADDIGPPGRDNECGFGELNIVKALTADAPPLDSNTVAPVPPSTAATTAIPSDATSAPGNANPAAQPKKNSSKSNSAIIIGGIITILVTAALVGFIALRRRRQ